MGEVYGGFIYDLETKKEVVSGLITNVVEKDTPSIAALDMTMPMHTLFIENESTIEIYDINKKLLGKVDVEIEGRQIVDTQKNGYKYIYENGLLGLMKNDQELFAPKFAGIYIFGDTIFVRDEDTDDVYKVSNLSNVIKPTDKYSMVDKVEKSNLIELVDKNYSSVVINFKEESIVPSKLKDVVNLYSNDKNNFYIYDGILADTTNTYVSFATNREGKLLLGGVYDSIRVREFNNKTLLFAQKGKEYKIFDITGKLLLTNKVVEIK